MDESYYLALAKRFWAGDRFFREEWFPTQLIGVLLLPFYACYHGITGGEEGIILCLRYLYVIFSGGIAITMYLLLQRIEGMRKDAAFFASVIYLLYVRGNIITLSYYSIGLGTFLVYLLLKYCVGTSGADFLAGISFAVSVLCMPYMVIYFVVVMVGDLLRKDRRWFFYAGILGSAAVFLLYTLMSGNFSDIFSNLPYILQDPEHQDTIPGALAGFAVFMAKTFYRFLLWPTIVEFAAIGWYCRKGRQGERIGKWLRWAAYMLFFLQAIYLRTFFEGGVLLAFLVLAIQIALINGNAKKRLLVSFFFPGILFGLIWVVGSNVGQRVFNMGGLIADIWALTVICEDICDQSVKAEKWFKQCSLAVFLGVIALIRVLDIYHDSSLDQLTSRIEEGAWKGIRTTETRNAEYMAVRAALKQYTDAGDVLAVKNVNPWIYLETSSECGGYSVWNTEFTDERNVAYYEKYPEKIPNVIFVMNAEYGEYRAWRFSSHGSNLEADESAEVVDGWFAELLEKEAYSQYETDCGTFYIKEY